MTDALGTTRQVVDTLQRTADEYSYNAWGEEFATCSPHEP